MSRVAGALRSRFTPLRVLLALVLVGAFLAVDAALESDRERPARDDAVRLVPAAALAYAHLTIDRDSESWKRASELTARLPGLARLRRTLERSLTPGGGAVDLAREVDPWIGDEAAVALLQSAGEASSLILADVADRELARSFLSRAVGRERESRYRGVAIRAYGALATAFIGDFLAVGRLEHVRSAVDAAAARLPSLDESAAFRRARSGLPDSERLAYGYASRDGVRRLLLPRNDIVGNLARLADDPALIGAAAAVRVEDEGARIAYAAALGRGGRKSPPRFRGRLLGRIPRDVLAYVGTRGTGAVIETATALAGAPPVAGPALERLRRQLRGSAGRRVERALRPLAGKEAGLYVSAPEIEPVLTLSVDDVDLEETGDVLDRLQPLFAGRIPGLTGGQVPTLEIRRIGGVDAVSLQLSPAIELIYAALGGRGVVTTDPSGIREARSIRSPIAERQPLSDLLERHDTATSVVFLDLERLLALGERAGLGETSGYRALRSNVSGMRTMSAVVSSNAASDKAEIFIEVP